MNPAAQACTRKEMTRRTQPSVRTPAWANACTADNSLLQSLQTSREIPETRPSTLPVMPRWGGHTALRMIGPRDPVNHARRIGEYQLRALVAACKRFDLRDM